MTKFRVLVLLVGALATCVAPLHATLIFQFDEIGDLAYSLSGAPYVPMADGVVEPDPTGNITGGVLVYNLTPELTSYDLFNGDAPISGFGGLAGDLRFTDPAGDLTGSEACGTTQCLMVFYVFDSNGLAADIGPVSTSFLTTQVPGAALSAGQFSYPVGALAYDGTINSVPEPAPAAMLLFSLAAFAFLHKRSKATIRSKVTIKM
jgi:hypothetical protein